MPPQQQKAPPPAAQVLGGREGARWINRRPEPEEFASWFTDNVPLDEGMEAKDYLGGMTLIPAQEKVKYVKGAAANGEPIIAQKDQLVYVPYPKVEARVSYYWKLMEKRVDDWVGVIEPVPTPRVEDESAVGQINKILPEGFFVLPVPVQSSYVHFICCTMRVRIYERPVETTMDGDRVIFTDAPIRQGRGTKQIPLLKRGYKDSPPYADDVALMRAETGALGRALGMAGILIVPGSSIATAEDMLEGFGTVPVPSQAADQPEAEQLTLPQVEQPKPIQTGAEVEEADREQLILQARETLAVLNDQYKPAYEEFRVWAAAKKPPVRDIGTLDGAALRGVVKKLTALHDAAKTKEEQDKTAEAPDKTEGVLPTPPEGGPDA